MHIILALYYFTIKIKAYIGLGHYNGMIIIYDVVEYNIYMHVHVLCIIRVHVCHCFDQSIILIIHAYNNSIYIICL